MRCVATPQGLLDRLGRATHDDEAVLVRDRAVVREAVDLVPVRVLPHLGDDDLDLEGLGVLGEDGAKGLRIGVGEPARGDVGPVVGVAAQIRIPDAGDPEVLELVVLPNRREGDPVIDLRDLVQRPRVVLGDEENALVVAEHDDGPAPGDALAGEVRPVLHQLLGRDVERHLRHRAPPGLSCRSATTVATTCATTSESRNWAPSMSTVAMVGQIRRLRSGPPVAESSSAAS